MWDRKDRRNNMNRDTTQRDQKLDLIAEIASYGLSHTQGDPDTNETYRLGAVDTVGHIIACCLSQWLTNEGEPTADTIEALGLYEYPSYTELRDKLKAYLDERNQPPAKVTLNGQYVRPYPLWKKEYPYPHIRDRAVYEVFDQGSDRPYGLAFYENGQEVSNIFTNFRDHIWVEFDRFLRGPDMFYQGLKDIETQDDDDPEPSLPPESFALAEINVRYFVSSINPCAVRRQNKAGKTEGVCLATTDLFARLIAAALNRELANDYVNSIP
jgi:hypothetical protein